MKGNKSICFWYHTVAKNMWKQKGIKITI